MILEIVNNVNCVPKKYKHSYLRSFLVLVSVTVMVGFVFTLFWFLCERSGARPAAAVTDLCVWGCFTDIADHRPDARPGGVQGDCRCADGRGIVGVPEQPLQHRGDDAGGRAALPHHHCHDPGTPTAARASSASGRRRPL